MGRRSAVACRPGRGEFKGLLGYVSGLQLMVTLLDVC